MAELKQAQWLFAGEAKFIAASNSVKSLTLFDLPEIAFIGRSNVGKSSLINALTNRLRLARTSHTPGRTKQLNFFKIRDKLILVDLPGYGYAKVSKLEQSEWQKLIMYYFSNRILLKKVCLLIDARRGIKDLDLYLMNILDELAINYQIILTKTDKCSSSQLLAHQSQISQLINNHLALHPEFFAISALKKLGLDTLKLSLASFVEFA